MKTKTRIRKSKMRMRMKILMSLKMGIRMMRKIRRIRIPSLQKLINSSGGRAWQDGR